MSLPVFKTVATALSAPVIRAFASTLENFDLCAGSKEATIIFYDNATEASGKVLWKLTVCAGSTKGRNFIGKNGVGLRAVNGIAIALTGLGAELSIAVG